jgi:amino acid permease
MGWSTYFAFIFAAINTLTVTYFLAIDNYPILKEIFPTFIHYIGIIISIGIPFLILIGYIHFKKSKAYKAEADISFESHPHMKRIYQNTEFNLTMQRELFDFVLKMNKENLSDEEISKIEKTKKIIQEHIDNKTDRLRQ